MSSSNEHGDRPWYLAHHFDTMGQQNSSAKLGMWLFLCTEVLMFSGLFLAYFIIRTMYPEMMLAAGEHLNKVAGGSRRRVESHICGQVMQSAALCDTDHVPWETYLSRMAELDNELTALIGDMTSGRQPPENTLEALLAASSELEGMAAQMSFR